MISVKASQKIFTGAEIANLTGICVNHLHNLAARHRLGFIASAAAASASQNDQWLFTSRDLMVLARLFPRCNH